jgi:hypothetical protein
VNYPNKGGLKSIGYTFEKREGYLVMRISGSYDYWQVILYPDLIRKQCEALGMNRILVDVGEVTYTELPTLELFFLGEKVAESLRDKVKIALVWEGDPQKDFLEIVAANRAASIRIFEKSVVARQWLLFDHEDEPFNFHKV